MNFLGYILGLVRFEGFSLLVPSVYLAALLIFAFSMWTHSPVSVVPQRRRVTLQLSRAVKLLLGSLMRH